MQSKMRLRNVTRFVMYVAVLMVGGVLLCATESATAADAGEKIVKSLCVPCHRIEGKPAPRKTKQAPDLIWAGNKYQQDWLVAWPQKPEFKHYPVGYDFLPERKKPHLALPVDQAKAVSQFLATRKDSRIKEGVMKPGTPEQLARGEKPVPGARMPELPSHAGQYTQGICGRDVEHVVAQVERTVESRLGLSFQPESGRL